MNKLKKLLFSQGSNWAYAIITAIFTLVPEDCFLVWKVCGEWKDSTNVLANRMIVYVTVFIIANIIHTIYQKYRNYVQITGDNFSIQIEYGDL